MLAKKRERDVVHDKRSPSKKAKIIPQDNVKRDNPSSILVSDEVDFPRGGGSTLTPLEYKTIQAEAARDVANDLLLEEPAQRKLKRRRKSTGEVGRNGAYTKNDGPRVDRLTYNKLSIGTKILCQIHAILPLALVVSLPSQLMGHIPITHISPQYLERLEKIEDEGIDIEMESGEDDDISERSRDAVPTLEDLFVVGQYLCAVVTALPSAGETNNVNVGKARDEAEKASKRIELSISPERINSTVSQKDLTAGFCLPASIKSVEDHGYVLSLGLAISGFLSFKNAKKGNFGDRKLSVGQVFIVSILSVSENGRTCTVTVDPAVLGTTITSDISNVDSVLPGMLVQGLVTAASTKGITVQILGFFDGSLDIFQLKHGDIESNYKIGKKIKARVIWNITPSPPKFALTALPHVLALEPYPKVAEQTVQESFPFGTIIDSAKVTRVEPDWGLVCQVQPGIFGFVHISKVSDNHVPSLSATSGAWKVGSTHPARVTGYSALDGLIQLTLQKSIIDQKVLQTTDVHVGEVIKGTVKSLSDVGLFVSISPTVIGVVWPLHYADITLKHPERRFKTGMTVKCKVLGVDAERKRISLTLKKSLVESKLPVVANFDDAKPGTITDAIIHKILPKSLVVHFFAGLRATVSLSEASDTPIQSADGIFSIGQAVKVRIMSVDEDTSHIVASIRRAVPTWKDPSDTSAVNIGDLVEGEVYELHKDNIVITLQPSHVRALLSLSHHANHHDMTISQLRTSLQPGHLINELVIVSKNAEKGIVIVAHKSAQKRAKPLVDGQSALRITSIHIGQVLSGRVVSYGTQGYVIRISNHITGILHPTDVSDDYSSVKTILPVNSFVTAVVLSIDADASRVVLSTRASRLRPNESSDVIDKEVSSIEDLSIGLSVRGFVKSVAEHGLFLTIGRNLDARVQIKELFDEFVKDWKSRFTVHQVVQGRIASISRDKGQIELTLRSGDINKITRSSQTMKDFEEGQKINGRVKRVEAYGLFIEIHGTKVSGLCHKSEISDNPEADVTQALGSFHEGDPVKAMIVSLDLEKKRIAFSLKPSHFNTEDFGVSDKESESDDQVIHHDTSDSEADVSEDESPGESSDELGDDVEKPMAAHVGTQAGTAVALKLNTGFRWTNQTDIANNDRGSGSESSDDEEHGPKRKKRRRHDIQLDMTSAMDSKTPESTADFERLVLGSPNSSFLWIQYMSFQLQLSEIDRARAIGKRALNAISFREEQEKLNVWIALLNLENTYGTEQTLETVFKDAVRHNDPKTVHLRMATILDETQKHGKAEEIFQRSCKKFGNSSKVWTVFGEHYLKQGKVEEARKVLPRSLLSLEKRKHLKTISKFALMEYKLGDPERGKTIFEGIIDSHPKRYDLWSVYADMETAQGDIQNLRSIFGRVLAQKLSSKKAKFFFKKWLEVERKLGNEDGVEEVKARAIEWTQKHGRIAE